MFSKIQTSKSTESFSDNIQKLKKAMDEADAVVIGAGAGLSAAAGFDYTGERFKKYFADFEEKYKFHDMYSGGFYPYKTQEEYWAFWSRYIYINRYQKAPIPVYEMLLGLVKEKDYFVITTNVDHCFQKAGFDKKRLFYTQGDYGLFQCSKPCCNKTFDNETEIRTMFNAQADGKIPTRLIPHCPVCGAPAVMNLRADENFVQDSGWYVAAEQYKNFLNAHTDEKILFLELGVGYNTPVIIKYPFWQMTAYNKNAVYAAVNAGQAEAPEEIKKRSICINADIRKALSELCAK